MATTGSVLGHMKCLKQLNHQTLNDIGAALNLEYTSPVKDEKVATLANWLSSLVSPEGISVFPDGGEGGSGGGGGGGSGGGGGGDSGDDSDDDDESEDSEDEGAMVINLKLDYNGGSTVSLEVAGWFTAGTLKGRVKSLLGISRRDQRIIFADKDLEDDKTLSGQNIQNGSTVHLLLRGTGGGKRGAAGAAKQKTKDEVLAEMTDQVGMAMLRFQASPHASPAIDNIRNKMTAIVQMVDRGVGPNDFAQMMVHLSDADLEKLQAVTALSTRPNERCKEVADVVFNNEIKAFKELKAQTKIAEGLLADGVHMLMINLFGDTHGGIGWAAFMKLVGEVVKHKVREGAAAAAAPANGLGA